MRKIALVYAVVGLLVFASACARTKEAYVSSGNELFQAGKFEEAALNYRKAISKDPRFGEAYYRLGLAALKQDDPKQALEALSRAAALLPSNIDAKEKLADLSMAVYLADSRRPPYLYDQISRLTDELLAQNPNSFQGLRLKGYLSITDRKIPEAIVFFRKSLEIKPMDPGVTTELVQALFQNSQIEEGEKLASSLIALKPKGLIYEVMYSWYYNSGRIPAAESVLKANVDNNPTRPEAILQLARHFARVQKPEQMHAALQRMLDNSKDFPLARLLVGNYYRGIGDLAQAIHYFEEGSNVDSKNRLVYQKMLVNALIAQGKKDEAAKVAEQILKEQPKDDEVLQVRATLWLESGRPESVNAASSDFQDLLTRHTDDPVLWFKAGKANRLKGDPDTAWPQFLEARRMRQDYLAPRYELAEISLEKQRPAESLQFSSEILSIQPSDQRGRLLHATGLQATGRLGEARGQLTELIKDFPHAADAQVQLGLLTLQERKYKPAIDIFEKLRSSEDPRAIAGLAAAYSSQNQPEKAIQLLSDALKKSPDSLTLHEQLANIAATNGRYEIAIAEFQKVLSYNRKSVPERLRLAEAYALKGDHNSSIAMYKEAHDLSPKDPVPALSLAVAYTKAGRTSEARAQYQRILDTDPKSPMALNNMAYLLCETGGNLDEALDFARRAIATKPDNPGLMDTMGYVYLKKGMHDSAIKTFENLVRKYPNYATFRYHLGMALFENGDKRGARRELEQALANNPSREEATKIKELVGKT